MAFKFCFPSMGASFFQSGKLPDNLLAGGYLLTAALLPWSVELDTGRFVLLFPAEPLMMLLGFLLLIRLIQMPASAKTLLKTPVFLAGTLWIIWQAAGILFSAMLLVSLKYWIAEAGHWWVFGLGFSMIPGIWPRFLNVFSFSIVGLTVYTMFRHGWYFQFRADQSLLAPMPFFPEHNMYAAVLAMVLFGLGYLYETRQLSGKTAISLAFFIILGLIASASRAALLSTMLCGLLYWTWKMSGSRWFGMLVIAAMIVLYCLSPMWTTKLQQDISFQERLNRYDCAERMLRARPWFGFGCGTFAFQYHPFQKAEKMTRISVLEPVAARNIHTYGRGGGAHSEYWRAASETGLPGLLIFTGCIFLFIRSGWRYRNPASAYLLLACLSFFIHGFVNDFLHDGRVACLVWGMVGSVACVEASHHKCID